MPRRQRLDAELVRRGLARSRDHAAQLISAGRVSVAGAAATKPATGVSVDAPVVVTDDTASPDYASRGGHKLTGALEDFGLLGLNVVGRLALDAGASTGGFTDVLLRAGVASVTAVDVGYGQLAWALRQDPRVTVMDRTNVRDLRPGSVMPPPDLVVADLSFISLGLVTASLAGVATGDADLVLMVKPQFEVGKDRLGKGVWCVTIRPASTPCSPSPRRPPSSASGCAGAAPVGCPVRLATSSTSCGCSEAHPWSTRHMSARSFLRVRGERLVP